MQARVILPYLLMLNGIVHNPAIQADDTTDQITNNQYAADQSNDAETSTEEEYESTGAQNNQDPVADDSWIPSTFPPLNPVPTYQEITDATAANEAAFEANLAYANQELEAYLRQSITNGSCDLQQVAALVKSIEQVYKALVRQSAFLVYAKAQRLQGETQYQAYQQQLAQLQAAIQQAAQQAGAAWFAVANGTGALADAVTASETAANSIALTQSQIDQVTAQVAALLAILAENYSA